MPACCPDMLLQTPCASSARVRTCGVGPLSATSEVYTGDGVTTEARRILHDFSPTSSSSALVAQLQLENLSPGERQTRSA